jgi:hypothetical protein
VIRSTRESEYLCARYGFAHSRLEIRWSTELDLVLCSCPDCCDYDDLGNRTSNEGEGGSEGEALADYAEKSGVPVSQLETGEKHV